MFCIALSFMYAICIYRTGDKFWHLALARNQRWTGILWCQSIYNAEVTRVFLVKNNKLCYIKSTNKSSKENKLSTRGIYDTVKNLS